eukprot:605426-Prymnesium_polylepis.1
MVHNACLQKRDQPCLNAEGCCSKGFPKKFCEETAWSEMEIYPEYRRRPPSPDAPPIEHRGRTLDNRWVVPYNPYLLLKVGAHINVEVCISVESVKYLNKYVYKGPDRAMARIDTNGTPTDVDEISNYQDVRCIGASEACWRLFEFDLYDRSPLVDPLPVHLPNEIEVRFPEVCDEEEAARHQERTAQQPQSTELTAWLGYVQQSGAADDRDGPWQQLTYANFPSQYRYDRKTGWHLRQRNRPEPYTNPQDITIGRINYAHPSCGERFYLRLLLTIVTGEELRSTAEYGLNSLKFGYETFQKACEARGLLANDAEWENVLYDAAATQMPFQMRQ